MEFEPTEYRKQIHIVGGGTIEPIRSHLALSGPAYGTTARQLAELCADAMPQMDVQLHLTKMADPASDLETSTDLQGLAREIAADYASKVVFWSPVVCDFRGRVGDVEPDKHAARLDSKQPVTIDLEPTPKIIPMFRRDAVDGRKPRKDILAVGFKTTTGAPGDHQFFSGLNLLKNNSLNLVLANDVVTRRNMVITPEESYYYDTTDRTVALEGLVDMVKWRSQMSFTESTVVKGEPVDWNSSEVFPALRTVVDYCRENHAYKPVNGKTAGHFAVKLDDHTFLTSVRKSNFNELDKVGLVRVETDGQDHVIAYGRKPSVGGQSQRIVFEQHPDKDCIVHFHCPIRPGSDVPTVSQREYECGSHQCGENTSRGLGSFEEGAIEAVYLDNHGPNIVFHHDIEPARVIRFIEDNFDLSAKTGGFIPAE